MQITPINNTPFSFQGYDARRLRAIAMTTNKSGIAQEIKDICSKYDVKVLLAVPGKLIQDTFEKACETCPNTLPWAQDIVNMTPNKKVYYPWFHDGLGWLLSQYEKLNGILTQNHIPGGNFFLVKNENSNDIIIGINELRKNRNIGEFIKKCFGIDNIHVIRRYPLFVCGNSPITNKDKK